MSEAEQAANAGDYATAEPLLREAALLQEAALGPLHPDLANTLNNLAVVCELTDKMADAEQYYRRAYLIATTSLPPGDELRATSERNLRDFCQARGRPFELPAVVEQPVALSQQPAAVAKQEGAVTTVTAKPVAPANPAALARPDARVKPPEAARPAAVVRPAPAEQRAAVEPAAAQPAASRKSAPPLRMGMLGGVALVILSFIAGFFWFRADAPGGSSPASPAPAAQATPTPLPPSAPAKPTPVPPASVPPAASAASRDAVAEPKSPAPRTAPAAGVPAIVEAQLCGRLSRGATWRCDPVNSPADPGRLFFYTRLKTASGTTVHHRWYRGERLIQAVELKIQPNAQGYRTYSQNTVNAQSGDWRVELAAANGAVLREVRFVVK